MATVTASFTFRGQELSGIPVINPGDHFGKAWLIELGGSNEPQYFVVEAGCVYDAFVALSDDPTHGHHVHADPADWDDYGPEDARFIDNTGHVIDLDWLSIWGLEGAPLPCPGMLYHGDDLLPEGVSPLDYPFWGEIEPVELTPEERAELGI